MMIEGHACVLYKILFRRTLKKKVHTCVPLISLVVMMIISLFNEGSLVSQQTMSLPCSL
jgi:hypothetical protein